MWVWEPSDRSRFLKCFRSSYAFEFYRIEEDANMINETKKNGGRIICVAGTTSCRTLNPQKPAGNGTIRRHAAAGRHFPFYPGYQFKILDCLITNFHSCRSPRSSCWYPHWQAEKYACSRRMKRRSGRDIGSLVLGMLCLSSREKGCMKKTHSERLWVFFISKNV